jgi:hypothetical protein
MVPHDNDNDPISFISLKAATLNAIRYLQKENDVDRAGKPDSEERGEESPKPDRAYVEQRLRDFAAFERRFGRNKN